MNARTYCLVAAMLSVASTASATITLSPTGPTYTVGLPSATLALELSADSSNQTRLQRASGPEQGMDVPMSGVDQTLEVSMFMRWIDYPLNPSSALADFHARYLDYSYSGGGAGSGSVFFPWDWAQFPLGQWTKVSYTLLLPHLDGTEITNYHFDETRLIQIFDGATYPAALDPFIVDFADVTFKVISPTAGANLDFGVNTASGWNIFNNTGTLQLVPVPAPEPNAFVLISLGTIGMLRVIRRRQR